MVWTESSQNIHPQEVLHYFTFRFCLTSHSTLSWLSLTLWISSIEQSLWSSLFSPAISTREWCPLCHRLSGPIQVAWYRWLMIYRPSCLLLVEISLILIFFYLCIHCPIVIDSFFRSLFPFFYSAQAASNPSPYL